MYLPKMTNQFLDFPYYQLLFYWYIYIYTVSLLVQFSHSVVSDSLQPHGLQHSRLPCPSVCPWVCSNSCPLSWWCHSTISSSVTPFSSCPQSFPASRSFLMSQLYALIKSWFCFFFFAFLHFFVCIEFILLKKDTKLF